MQGTKREGVLATEARQDQGGWGLAQSQWQDEEKEVIAAEPVL